MKLVPPIQLLASACVTRSPTSEGMQRKKLVIHVQINVYARLDHLATAKSMFFTILRT
jgi:hypothetical protein